MLYKEYIKDKSQDEVLGIIKEINWYANLFMNFLGRIRAKPLNLAITKKIASYNEYIGI